MNSALSDLSPYLSISEKKLDLVLTLSGVDANIKTPANMKALYGGDTIEGKKKIREEIIIEATLRSTILLLYLEFLVKKLDRIEMTKPKLRKAPAAK